MSKKQLEDMDGLVKVRRPHQSLYEHIKIAFVEGELDNKNNRIWPTLPKLAKKFKLNITTIDKHALNENWKILRSQFQLKLESVRQDMRIESLSKEIVMFDNLCFETAKFLIERIKEKLIGSNDLYSMESIARTLEKAQKVGRLASGESTDNTRKDLVVTFSQGLDMVRKNLESHPDVLKQLKDKTVDGDPSILPTIDLKEGDSNVFEKLNIQKENDAQ